MTSKLRLMHKAARESKLYVFKTTGFPTGLEWVAALYAIDTLVTLAAGCGSTPLEAIQNVKYFGHNGGSNATG